MRRHAAATLLMLALIALAAGEALARGAPFGLARPEPAFQPSDFGPLEGLVAWITVRQAEIYRGLTGLVGAVRDEPAAAWALVGASFLYGALHAAGPGHGKAVISSYLLAAGAPAPRAVAISMAAAAVQGLTAVALVGVVAGLARATGVAVQAAALRLETLSYAAIALIGLWLILRALGLTRHTHTHAHAHAHAHGAAGAPVHGCGHSHYGVDPRDLAGPLTWRRSALAIAAVGLRPCTGAILVLVFALAQGLFALGVVAVAAMAFGTGLAVAVLAGLALGARDLAARLVRRRPLLSTMLPRAIEFVGALIVCLFGLVMLAGALAAA